MGKKIHCTSTFDVWQSVNYLCVASKSNALFAPLQPTTACLRSFETLCQWPSVSSLRLPFFARSLIYLIEYVKRLCRLIAKLSINWRAQKANCFVWSTLKMHPCMLFIEILFTAIIKRYLLSSMLPVASIMFYSSKSIGQCDLVNIYDCIRKIPFLRHVAINANPSLSPFLPSKWQLQFNQHETLYLYSSALISIHHLHQAMLIFQRDWF